ncbi:MAG: PAS domain S-box protein [Candidatus Parcubacteria bacterium]|nr:PAS domain S-box protein [Candidatus Parcubacteria bacterium]
METDNNNLHVLCEKEIKNLKTERDILKESYFQLKELKEKLEESERRFKNIFDYTSVGVSVVAPDGHWLEVNDSLCKITGYSREELLTKQFNKITYSEDVEKSAELSRKILSGEVDHASLEKRYTHKNGHIVWVNLSIALVRDDKNIPLYFVVHTEDITKRREAEKALKEKVGELEKMNSFMVGREEKMMELKKEIEELKKKK